MKDYVLAILVIASITMAIRLVLVIYRTLRYQPIIIKMKKSSAVLYKRQCPARLFSLCYFQ